MGGNKVNIDIAGTDQVTVDLVTSAVAYGLDKCGFTDVNINTMADNTCIVPDENLPDHMAELKRENQETFNAEITVGVVTYYGEDPSAEGGEEADEGEVEE